MLRQTGFPAHLKILLFHIPDFPDHFHGCFPRDPERACATGAGRLVASFGFLCYTVCVPDRRSAVPRQGRQTVRRSLMNLFREAGSVQLFTSTLNQMLFLFGCILIGFLLNRTKVLPENTGTVLSKLEAYVLMPALVVSSFQANCTLENLSANRISVLVSLLVLGISIAAAFLLGGLFTKNREEVGLYRYSIAVTNFGFVGNAMVLGLLGEEGLFRYLVFTLPMSLFVYTLGIYWLTAGAQKFTWRDLLSPKILSVVIGIVLGLTQIPIPTFVGKILDGCSACFSPVAMILAGFVIAQFKIGKLLKEWKVYILAAVRMVVMPLAFYGLCLLLDVPEDVRVLVLFATAMPLGLNTIVFPAAYGLNVNPGASMAVIANILGLITVPLILMLA